MRAIIIVMVEGRIMPNPKVNAWDHYYISSIQGLFSGMAGCHFSRDLTRCLLISGCGQSHVSAKHG